eukprot:1381581-Amorphochlora_amoeboformis.AAC.1
MKGNSQVIQEISRNILTSQAHSNPREVSGSATWRDVTSCHVRLGSPVTTGYVTNGYCRLLPDETIFKNLQNLQNFQRPLRWSKKPQRSLFLMLVTGCLRCRKKNTN